MEYRIEKDMLGEKKIENSQYYGINTLRALENFNVSNRKVNVRLIKAMVMVKKAAAITNNRLGRIEDEISKAMIEACDEIIAGHFQDQFVVDALQGGAGTSTNMNVNEVIANRAIEILGYEKGTYSIIHPLNHVNMSQSTNDVYPTALRIAAIELLREVSEVIADLQTALQEKENEFSDILKLGRTQLMDALPMMAGQGFGAFARAIARDRWRIYKVEERVRQINMGATAIGTGLNATHKFIYMITDTLQDLTGFGLARSEFPMDITQNTDVFVEVSGLLKSAAVNLTKISNDIRLLSSGPKGGIGEFIISPVQAGSSIMAGKINPVIPEMMFQVGAKIMSNDQTISYASASGQLELNAFSPLIAESLIESLELLLKAVPIFNKKCIQPIKVNKEKCEQYIRESTVYATALLHHIGYDKASEVAKTALRDNKPIKEVVLEKQYLSKEQLEKILNPFELTKPGIPGFK